MWSRSSAPAPLVGNVNQIVRCIAGRAERQGPAKLLPKAPPSGGPGKHRGNQLIIGGRLGMPELPARRPFAPAKKIHYDDVRRSRLGMNVYKLVKEKFIYTIHANERPPDLELQMRSPTESGVPGMCSSQSDQIDFTSETWVDMQKLFRQNGFTPLTALQALQVIPWDIALAMADANNPPTDTDRMWGNYQLPSIEGSETDAAKEMVREIVFNFARPGTIRLKNKRSEQGSTKFVDYHSTVLSLSSSLKLKLFLLLHAFNHSPPTAFEAVNEPGERKMGFDRSLPVNMQALEAEQFAMGNIRGLYLPPGEAPNTLVGENKELVNVLLIGLRAIITDEGTSLDVLVKAVQTWVRVSVMGGKKLPLLCGVVEDLTNAALSDRLSIMEDSSSLAPCMLELLVFMNSMEGDELKFSNAHKTIKSAFIKNVPSDFDSPQEKWSYIDQLTLYLAFEDAHRLTLEENAKIADPVRTLVTGNVDTIPPQIRARLDHIKIKLGKAD